MKLGRTFICGLLIYFILNGTLFAMDRNRLRGFVYEDNKRLIILVEEAAGLIEQKGEDAFKDFSVKESKWLNGSSYIFVYDISGKCIFHPIEPWLVGQDLSTFKDMEKRPAIAMIAGVGKNPEPDASNWIFYLWEPPQHTYPVWKGSYVRKAIAPGGKIYLVGSGLYNIKIEKAFIQENVDNAAEMVLAKGVDVAFRELMDRSCPLHILNSYIFVLDESGNVVVDALFPNLEKKRNLAQYRDDTGRFVFVDIKAALQNKDSIWVFYIAPNMDSNRPARHYSYVRKIKIDEKVFYVAASFIPAMPIWMKQ